MGESNTPVSTGCGDEGTTILLGDYDLARGRASGSLAATGDHWYIAHKALQREKMFREDWKMRIRQADSVRIARISARTATWLAWSLWVACVALIALALLLDFFTDYVPLLSGERLDPGIAILTGVLSLAYPTVGALIASRLPTNPIGWIFCGVGLLYAAQRLTEAYADYALLENFALPWGEYVAWFTTWVGFAGPVLAGIFLMLLFPDGRLPSRRWRIVAWTAVLGAALTALGDAFAPGKLRTHPYIENPLGVVGVIGGGLTTYEFFAASLVFGTTLLLGSSLTALCSLIVRLRRGRGDERQQIKWFLYAAVPGVVSLSPALLDAILVHFTSNFLLFDTAFNYNVNSVMGLSHLQRLWGRVRCARRSSFHLHCHTQVSPLRRRCSHKPHARLRLPYGHAGGPVFWGRDGGSGFLPYSHRPREAAAVSHSCLHTCDRCVVQPPKKAHPGFHR